MPLKAGATSIPGIPVAVPFSFCAQASVVALGFALLTVALIIGAGSASGTDAGVSRPGDTYVEAMVGAPRLVNPLLAVSDTDVDLAHLVFSGLTRVDRQGRIVPDLASGWDVGPDGRVYTFTLRPNLRWHDGEALTADDVFFTLKLLQDKQFPGDPALASAFRDVKVEAPSASMIRFTLPAADSSFPQATTVGILPRHLWSDIKVSDLTFSPLNTNPVGSGPWRYVGGAASPGESGANGDAADGSSAATRAQAVPGVMLEPYLESWLPAPRIARLWMRPYPSFGAALSGFAAGEVHGLGHISPDRLDDVSAVTGADLHAQTLARYSMLVLNTRSPLLNRPETRRAIELAIDRQALIDGAHLTALVADSPVLPHSQDYDSTTRHQVHDPAAAGRLLDSAGWLLGPGGVRARGGVTMTLVLATNKDVPSNVDVARLLARQLGAVGIDVQIAALTRDSLLRDYVTPGAFHMALLNWTAPGPEPELSDYWHSTKDGQGSLNHSGWANALADRALDDARQASDAAPRTTAYGDFQKAFAEDVPAVILYSPLYSYATRAPAAGVSLPATDMLNPSRRFDTIGEWYLQAGAMP